MTSFGEVCEDSIMVVETGAPMEQHPMVPVPEAIRMVLSETAKMLLQCITTTDEEIDVVVDAVNNPWQTLLGRTISRPVTMPAPGYPPYAASIMDGYAIQTEEYIHTSSSLSRSSGGRTMTHSIGNKVFAGDPVLNRVSEPIQNGLPTAVYVTTGAVIPQGFDCVVPVEDILKTQDHTIQVSPTANIQKGAWIRKVGCDIEEGTIILPKGYLLDPVGLGLIQQSGQQTVQVKKLIQIGILSTGNELIRHNEDRNQLGRIPDANRPLLLALASTFGTCTPIDLGIHRDDDIEALTNTIQIAFLTCDVVITTGGISMGETDIVEQVLVERLGGTLHFGRMHMKPGKPTTFVTLCHQGVTKLVFAMPGNPVSAVVCTQLLVRPCLDLLFHGDPDNHDNYDENSVENVVNRMVDNAWVHTEITATLTHGVKLDLERPEYHRVTLQQSNGVYKATSTGVQQSSRLMSLQYAHGLLILPQGTLGGKMTADAGEQYTVLMIVNNNNSRTRVCDSRHLNQKSRPPFRIAFIHVVAPNAIEIEDSRKQLALRVQTSLSGITSGPAEIVSSRTFAATTKEVFAFCSHLKDDVDIFCVVCQNYPGSFRRHVDVSSELRRNLDKVADAMALQARQGAASDDATAALFEVVVGFVPQHKAMLICIPEQGMEGALFNVRGLLKHSLKVGRGKVQ